MDDILEGASVAEALAAMNAELVEALNIAYDDSVLLAARVLGERPQAQACRVTEIHAAGIDVVVTDPDGEHVERLLFDEEVTDPTQLTERLFALVRQARELSGEDGMTSAERDMAEMAGIRTFLTHVVDVEEIHPHLRRITFGGGDLKTFVPAGPDTFLYLLLPPPGRTELTIDQSFTWEAYHQMDEAERPVGAYYTVRRWRPEQAEVDMLFVLHGDSGPASAWAHGAKPGDPVALWGPRTSYHPPVATDWFLLVVDETGLPAAATILEQLPEGTTVRLFAEVADESEQHPLPESSSFEVTWVHRHGSPAGTTTSLADAVRAMPWPGGTPYAWGGGESRAVTAVRKYLRNEVGLPRDAVSMVGYWRHDDSPEEPDD